MVIASCDVPDSTAARCHYVVSPRSPCPFGTLVLRRLHEFRSSKDTVSTPFRLFSGTSFCRFRRTSLEGVFRSCAVFQGGRAPRKHAANGLICSDCKRLGSSPVQAPRLTWRHHEQEDRDAQDRASRPSAVATRRPAQTSSRPERPEVRAARRNELRRADRVSPEAPKHALQREARQSGRV